VTLVNPTDYEDNKMKKDSLATLHCYDSNQLLSNLQLNISNVLNNKEFQWFFEKFLPFFSKNRNVNSLFIFSFFWDYMLHNI